MSYPARPFLTWHRLGVKPLNFPTKCRLKMVLDNGNILAIKGHAIVKCNGCTLIGPLSAFSNKET
jgi:hypothetical protein